MSNRNSIIFLGALLALFLPFTVQMFWPFLTSFILAVVLAILLNPWNRSLVKRMERPALATFVTTFTAVLALGLLLGFTGYALTRELSSTYETLNEQSVQQGGWPALAGYSVDRLVNGVHEYIPFDREAIRKYLLDSLEQVTSYVQGFVVTALGGFTSFLFTAIGTTVFLYFFLLRGEVWLRWLSMWTPLNREVTDSLFLALKNSVIANINGVFAVVIAQGVCLSIGFWFVGMGSPILWGAVGGLASIVPFIGSPLIWLPIVMGYVLQGDYWVALGLGLWGAFVVGSVDDVLRPYVVGSREKLHPLLIALAAIGGTYEFGALGFLLGPLVLSLVVALIKELQALVAEDREESADSAEESDQGPLLWVPDAEQR